MSELDVLLLNANYEPLNVCDLRRAVTLVLVGKAEVIEKASSHVCSSEARWIAPSIVRMRYQVKRPMPKLKLSRHSILARDFHTCQYCGSNRDLTIDHVTPRSHGGGSCWTNCVLACIKCNHSKADRTPAKAGMTLLNQPKQPKWNPIYSQHTTRYQSWSKFISDQYWNAELAE